MNNSLRIPKCIPARWMTLCLAGLLGVLSAIFLNAQEITNGPVSPPIASSTTNAEALRSFLLLQEQIHATQLSLERNRQETEAMAARNAELISDKLEAIEQTLAWQRQKDLEAVQSSNKLLLIVGGSLAGVGFLAMLITAYLQWRSVNRLAEFASLLPMSRPALSAGSPMESQLISTGSVADANARLFGALTELEKRIHELENTTRTPLTTKSVATENHVTAVEESSNGRASEPQSADANGVAQNGNHTSALLEKGQNLLNADKPGEALKIFEEILSNEPNHVEALVKKGVALESMRRNDEALQCYDQAIAADDSMTIAYLHKGGLCNRLERFNEALECYEAALRSQEKARSN